MIYDKFKSKLEAKVMKNMELEIVVMIKTFFESNNPEALW